MSVRLMLVDDHEMVRLGLKSLLEGTDIEVVGEAADGVQAVAMVRALQPDVILLDMRMAGGDGLDAIAGIRQESPDSKVVILSSHNNPTYVARAHMMGAVEYILKGADRDTIISTIKSAYEGELPTPQGEMKKVSLSMAQQKPSAQQEPSADSEIKLTQRELQVLRHLALGLSNKDISNSLGISLETVKEHVQHLLRKMGVNDRTKAAVWALKNGLID